MLQSFSSFFSRVSVYSVSVHLSNIKISWGHFGQSVTIPELMHEKQRIQTKSRSFLVDGFVFFFIKQ